MKTLIYCAALLTGLRFCHAQSYTPIAVTPASFNVDIVVPASLNQRYRLNAQAVTVSLGSGPGLEQLDTIGYPEYYSITNGQTWFEQGVDRSSLLASNTYGLPHAGEMLTNSSLPSHVYRFYQQWTNYSSNVLFVGNFGATNNYGGLPLSDGIYSGKDYTSARFALLDSPGGGVNLTRYTALSLLASSGFGPAYYTVDINYSDGSAQELANVGIPDWWGKFTNGGSYAGTNTGLWNSTTSEAVSPLPTVAYSAEGRIQIGADFSGAPNSTGLSTGSLLWSIDIGLGNSFAAPTNITLTWTSGGQSMVFAVSGSTNRADFGAGNPAPLPGPFTPIAVAGFNAGGVIPNDPATPVTATMDAGTNIFASYGGVQPNSTWFEAGYDLAAPTNGFPAHNSVIVSHADPLKRYQMAPSYDLGHPMATLIDRSHVLCMVTPAAPAAFSSISVLSSGANIGAGGTMTGYIIFQHNDGINETNILLGYDWYNTQQPYAWIANERVSLTYGSQVENLNADSPRLFDAAYSLADTSPLTNVVMGYLAAPEASSLLCVFALSGVPLPPSQPSFTGISRSNGAVTFNVTNLNGQGSLVLEASTNLLQWYPVLTNPPAFGQISLTDTNPINSPWRFYRMMGVATP